MQDRGYELPRILIPRRWVNSLRCSSYGAPSHPLEALARVHCAPRSPKGDQHATRGSYRSDARSARAGVTALRDPGADGVQRHGRKPACDPGWVPLEERADRRVHCFNAYKVKALAANPKVALTIDTDAQPYRALLVRGTASVE